MKANEKETEARKRQKPIAKPLCPKCKSENMIYVSTGRAKGKTVRYFDCGDCFSSWRQWGDDIRERAMPTKSPQPRQEGVIKGARVHIDGKFVGIAK